MLALKGKKKVARKLAICGHDGHVFSPWLRSYWPAIDHCCVKIYVTAFKSTNESFMGW